MRAMPSETEVMTPSWASTTLASKLAMRALRMSPISSLRSAILCALRPSVVRLCERRLELLQPSPHAAVDDAITDADHQAAQDRRVMSHRGLHLAAEPLAERGADGLLQGRVDGDRRHHLGADAAAGGVGDPLVLLEHLGQHRDAAALEQQARQVAHFGRRLLESAEGEALAIGGLDAGGLGPPAGPPLPHAPRPPPPRPP